MTDVFENIKIRTNVRRGDTQISAKSQSFYHLIATLLSSVEVHERYKIRTRLYRNVYARTFKILIYTFTFSLKDFVSDSNCSECSIAVSVNVAPVIILPNSCIFSFSFKSLMEVEVRLLIVFFSI